MGMAAALWDVLAKAANLAQMTAMIVAVGTSLLRVPESNRECAELERWSRRLRAFLQWPTGCGVALLCSEMGGPVVKALGDPASLVDSYNRSTLWCRLWSASRTATQLRDMQDVINSYRSLLLSVNAHLLLQQQATHQPPSSDTTTIHEENDPSQSQSARAMSNCPTVTVTRDAQKANDIGEGGMCSRTDDTEMAGCDRSVPTIVISHG